MWILLALTACKDVAEAPTDLDGLVRFTWSSFDGSAEELDQALTNLDEVLDWQGLSELQDGTVSDLTADDLALVGLEDLDSEALGGVYMLNPLACEFEHLEEILLYAHQDELWDIYTSYQRTFTGDEDAYRSGTAESVDWRVDYSSEVLTTPYDAWLGEEIRRVTTETWGDVIQLRRAMPEPCVFAEDSDYVFAQDYTIRTFWQRAPGDLVHLYGMWREVDFGAGLTSDDEALQRLLLNGLADLDEEAEQYCLDGVP